MTDRPNKPVKPRKGQPQRRKPTKKTVQTTAAVFAGAGLTLALVPLLPNLIWVGVFVSVVALILVYL